MSAEHSCARRTSSDERAVIRLIGSALPSLSGTAARHIPPGLAGALALALLSVRRLCGEIVPPRPYPPADVAAVRHFDRSCELIDDAGPEV